MRVSRRAGWLLAAGAMLPMAAVAQSNSAAPQSRPGLDNFNLPPKPTPTPAPPPSGPIVAPLSRPTPTPVPTPSASPIVTPPPVAATVPAPATTGARPTRPVASPSATPQATPPASSPTPQASSLPAAPPPVPTASATPAPVDAPVSVDQPASGISRDTMIAIGVGILAVLGALYFLFGRRRRRDELAEEAPVEPAAPAPPAPAIDELRLDTPLKGLLTVPSRTRRRVHDGAEPRIEIILIPRRAGTNLTSAAVDYRVVVRNAGQADARDIRLGIYMLSASARQAADLQMIFAAEIATPVVTPFALAVGAEIELSGMAMLPRENINVMTIDGKPWFVPVMAMKAEYRWGENVGVAGVATAAHMIGIDRGQGAKMAPFRLDGGAMMHPQVAERKVA
ncbi:MAG: hypothetical protein V4459_15150 [Pseudomonadota bacterium]